MKQCPSIKCTPAEILARGTVVKSNPVRKVLRLGEFYLKLDARSGSSFAKEYRGAQLLARAGIPVVEHLACGRIPEGSYLITRAWGDGTTVQNYVMKNGADEEFLAGLTEFLNRFYATNLWHGDLHWGNLLYDRERRQFAFVDVRAVCRAPFRRWFCGSKLRHVVMDLRMYLPRPRLLRLLSELGIARPEPWFLHNLDADARRIVREWPRRKRQILSGYPKFTIGEGGKLWSVPRLLAAEAGLEHLSGADAENVFLAHFYLQLQAIPHRRAIWFDPESRTVALEAVSAAPEPHLPLSAEELADWQDRLRRIGGKSAPSDWERRGNAVFYRGTVDFAKKLSETGGFSC